MSKQEKIEALRLVLKEIEESVIDIIDSNEADALQDELVIELIQLAINNYRDNL
jgi:hypothetical protein